MQDKKMHTIQGAKGYPMESPSRMLPSFSLTADDLPEIKNWQVGKKYKLEIEVEQVSISKDEWTKDNEISARFRIHKVKDCTKADPAKKGYE